MINWNNDEPPSKGVYITQQRSGLGHLEVRYDTAYWTGGRWHTDIGYKVYYWSAINQAPEPENCFYHDELSRLKIVAADQRGVDLHTPLAKGTNNA